MIEYIITKATEENKNKLKGVQGLVFAVHQELLDGSDKQTMRLGQLCREGLLLILDQEKEHQSTVS